MGVAGDRHHVHGVRLVRVHADGEPEVGREVAADLVPRAAGVVGAHDVPVFLHVEHLRPGGVHRHPVHAVADLGVLVGDAPRTQAPVHRFPGLAVVVGAERARRGDAGVHPPRMPRVQDDRVQAHPARARLPGRPGAVGAQPRQLGPVLPAVGGLEQPGVLHPGVDRVRVVRRGLQVPDPGELPRVRRSVVPLVGPGLAVVLELVAHRLPGHAAVVGALDDLPEPPAGLGGEQPVRVGGRPGDVIDLPAREERPADLPFLPLAVGVEHERALARPDQYPYLAHHLSLPRGHARRP